jgi:hypothetical protein
MVPLKLLHSWIRATAVNMQLGCIQKNQNTVKVILYVNTNAPVLPQKGPAFLLESGA